MCAQTILPLFERNSFNLLWHKNLKITRKFSSVTLPRYTPSNIQIADVFIYAFQIYVSRKWYIIFVHTDMFECMHIISITQNTANVMLSFAFYSVELILFNSEIIVHVLRFSSMNQWDSRTLFSLFLLYCDQTIYIKQLVFIF